MKNAVNLYIRDSQHNIPYGDDRLWIYHKNEHACSWTRNGIHYAIWMTDIESGEVSSVFYPGDQEYNFEYRGRIDDDFDWGWLYYSLDNFKSVGREKPLEVNKDDIMHIRLMYNNPNTGATEVWYLDTAFVEPPPPVGVDIFVTLHELTKEDESSGYECFLLPETPSKKYFTPVIRNPRTYRTEVYLGFPDSADVIFEIRDIFGEYFRYTEKKYAPGQYRIIWDGLDPNGKVSKSGTYIFNLFIKNDTGEMKLFNSRRLLYFIG